MSSCRTSRDDIWQKFRSTLLRLQCLAFNKELICSSSGRGLSHFVPFFIAKSTKLLLSQL